jgi:hypothetical protein
MIEFRLNKAVEVPDTLGEDGGVAGGPNSHDQVLPPVVFPKTEINTKDPGSKVEGSLRGPLVLPGDGNSESDTDSDEDEEGDDTHKLHQLAHAHRMNQPITVGIQGQYHVGDRLEEVRIQCEVTDQPAPSHILEPLQWTMKGLELLAKVFGSEGVPGSCRWSLSGVPREGINIKVEKMGRGVYVTYGHKGTVGLDMSNFLFKAKADLVTGWSIVFGTPASPSDGDITDRLASIMALWRAGT